MSSFLCFVCHSTVNADTNEDTREKYREVIGMNLCPDSHLCYICCYFLNKMCMFKSICLKRSLEYPVLFSEKGTINLHRSETSVSILCPEDICIQHLNTRYHFYNNNENSQSDFDDTNYCELQDDRNFDINDTLLKTAPIENFRNEDYLFVTKDNICDNLFNEELIVPNLEPVRITQNDLVNGEWTQNVPKTSNNTNTLLELNCRNVICLEELGIPVSNAPIGIHNVPIVMDIDGKDVPIECTDTRNLQDVITGFNYQHNHYGQVVNCVNENIQNNLFHVGRSNTHDNNLNVNVANVNDCVTYVNDNVSNINDNVNNTNDNINNVNNTNDNINNVNNINDNINNVNHRNDNINNVNNRNVNVINKNDNITNANDNTININDKITSVNDNRFSVNNNITNINDIATNVNDHITSTNANEADINEFTPNTLNVETPSEADNPSDSEEITEVRSKSKTRKEKKLYKKITLTLKEQKQQLGKARKDENYIAASYKCHSCAVYFHFKDTYQTHMMRHEESNGEHFCSICSLRFANPAVLRLHTANHSVRYKCRHCSGSVRAGQRSTHARHCTGKRDSVNCHLCGRMFQSVRHFQQHLQRYHDTSLRRYLCNVCGKSYDSRPHLRTHIITHINRKFECNQCPSTFSSPYTLNHHKKSKHVTKEPEVHHCAMCKLSYSTRKSLLAHMRNALAHKESVYKCGVCGRTCPSLRALEAHTASVHTRSRHLACRLCQKRYSTNKTLANHMASHKEGRSVPLCHSCGATFKSTTILKKHLKNVCEKETRKCQIIDEELLQVPFFV